MLCINSHMLLLDSESFYNIFFTMLLLEMLSVG